jgi:hypothetical protein
VRLLDTSRKTLQFSGNEISSKFSKFKIKPKISESEYKQSVKIEENMADVAKKLFESLEKITLD